LISHPLHPPPHAKYKLCDFEKRVQRVMLGPKREEVNGGLTVLNDDVFHYLWLKKKLLE